MDLTHLSIDELQTGYKSRRFTVTEVVRGYLDRINKLDKNLNSFITVQDEEALLQASRLDKKIKTNNIDGRLFGVPMAIKDIICTKNLLTTAGSKMLANYIPPYSATVYEKVLAAQAVVLGKTNCDEFAMGASGENSSFGPTKNPWDLTRVPGGSSSGSAVAVAARFCRVALGTDTGGSVRQPAGFCGVVGIKPTYSRVSRHGLLAMASSFDQVGVLSPTVKEAAQVLQVIAGPDEFDSTLSPAPVPNYFENLSTNKKFKIGVPKEFFAAGVDEEVKDAVRSSVDQLKTMRYEVKSVNLPSVAYSLPVYYIIVPAEVSANLARYDGLRYGARVTNNDLFTYYTTTRGQYLGTEVKRRIMLGTYVLSVGYYEAYYRQALKAQQYIKREFEKIFKKVDALVGPTSPTVAFKLGEKLNDPLAMYMSDINTVPVNIAGLPGISIPIGLSQGLPVGLQIIAPWFKEETIFQIATSVEQSRGGWQLPN